MAKVFKRLGGTTESQFLVSPAGVTGPPTTNEHFVGEEHVDSAGSRYVCIAQGTPGTWIQLMRRDDNIEALANVDPSNLTPAANQTLSWNNTLNRWERGAQVTSQINETQSILYTAGTASTTSTTFVDVDEAVPVQLTELTLNSGDGRYLLFLTGVVYSSGANRDGDVIINVDGVDIPASEIRARGNGGQRMTIGTHYITPTVTNGVIAKLRWRISAGSFTFQRFVWSATKLTD